MNKECSVPTTRPAQIIAALYRRRLTSPWNEKEIRSYKKLVKAGAFTTLDDLDLICRYYESERKKGDNAVHRRELYTFVNNYWGELDKARAWEERRTEQRKMKATPKHQNGEQPLNDEEFQAVGALAIAELRRFKQQLKTV